MTPEAAGLRGSGRNTRFVLGVVRVQRYLHGTPYWSASSSAGQLRRMRKTRGLSQFDTADHNNIRACKRVARYRKEGKAEYRIDAGETAGRARADLGERFGEGGVNSCACCRPR